jgi:hypothetical protein
VIDFAIIDGEPVRVRWARTVAGRPWLWIDGCESSVTCDGHSLVILAQIGSTRVDLDEGGDFGDLLEHCVAAAWRVGKAMMWLKHDLDDARASSSTRPPGQISMGW